MQYVSKAETLFIIQLNNYRLDISNLNAIPACCHFAYGNHNFNIHSKFTLIKTINRKNVKDIIQDILRRCKNFWITTLETMLLPGLNQELNPIQLHPQLTDFTNT